MKIEIRNASGSVGTSCESVRGEYEWYHLDFNPQSAEDFYLQIKDYTNKSYTWQEINADPTERFGHAMVYDYWNNKAIFFGGMDGGNAKNDAWVYDLASDTWTKKAPVISPCPRYAPAMTYDSNKKKTVLFGGIKCWECDECGDLYDDTWIYDVITDTWIEKYPTTKPDARTDHSMVYASDKKKVVLFGGQSYESSRSSYPIYYDDTWLYDLSTNTWIEVDAGDVPSARSGHKMVYDSKNNKVVLFGGYYESESGSSIYDDTWVYDVASETWTEMDTEISPPERAWHDMVYASATNQIILFGGDNPELEINYDDTWVYDLSSNEWTEMKPTTTPSARWGHAMVYDPIYNKVILYGGGGNDETWAYDISTNVWTQKNIITKPSERGMHATAFDSKNNKIVLFGGNVGIGSKLSDTWVYDVVSDNWLEKNPSLKPSARRAHAMVYDVLNKQIVLFGGWDVNYNDETWVYYVNNNTWKKMRDGSTEGDDPSGRYGHSLVYDSTNNLIVLFGGNDSSGPNDETWVYNSTSNNWTKKRDGGTQYDPDERLYHAMVYDSINKKVILFGGYNGVNSYFDDTWVYNYTSNSWWEKSTGGSPGEDKPTERYGHVMAYDQMLNKTILFGGTDINPALTYYSTPYFHDTWVYDYASDTWKYYNYMKHPTGVRYSSMVYDSLNKRTIMFGGADGWCREISDTWSYDVTSLLIDKVMFVKTSEIYKNYLADGYSAKYLTEEDFINGIYRTAVNLESSSYVTAFSMKLCGEADNFSSKPLSNFPHFLTNGNQTTPDIYENIVVWSENLTLKLLYQQPQISMQVCIAIPIHVMVVLPVMTAT